MLQPFDRGFNDVLALFGAGRLAEAEAAAFALAAAHPAAVAAHNILGVIQASGGKSSADTHFQKAIALKPDWDEPYANLGLTLCQRRDFAAAEAPLRTALDLKPTNAAAAVSLGNALRELGARDEAAARYRQALAAGADQAVVHNNLGAVLLDLARASEAAASFRRAVEIHPAMAEAHLNLGRALRHQGHFAESLPSLERAMALNPTSGETAVVLANTLRDLGRTTDAIAVYSRALELKPDDREAGYNLGLALNAAGRHGEGLAAIAASAGIAHLSVTPSGPAPARVDIAAPTGPTFIGAWRMDRPEDCDQLIDFFERRELDHAAGRSARGLDTTVKHSTDLTVLPKDLDKPEFAAVKAHLRHLEACIGDYGVQWPHFGAMLKQVDVGPFTLQRYEPGGHFQHIHAERMSFGFIHRVLAWMTYLNDVEDGGETTFPHYDLTVRPQRGKTLIWPAEWTHVHAGMVVKTGRKYIITGWMHFPHSSGPIAK